MPTLTAVNVKQVAIARSQLADNPGFYARSLSAAIRCASTVQQVRALWNVIDADDAGHLFDDSNPLCPIAKAA